MAEEKISTILLRYSVDKNALNQAIASSKSLRTEMASVAQSAKSVDLATLKVGTTIRDSFGSQGSSRIKALNAPIETATKSMNTLKESVLGVQQEIKTLSSLKAADIVDPELGDVLGGSGKRNLSQTLKFIGREGRALPSQQIPGLGVGTDAISKIIGLMGSLSPVALGAGVAVAGFSLAIVALQANATKAKDAALADLDARQRALQLLSAGNKAEVQERIKALQEQKAANLQAVNDAASIQHQLQQGIYETYGIVGFGITQINAALGTGAGELSATAADLEAANKTFNETSTELAILEQGVNGLGDAAAAATLELARANNAIALDTARINAQIEASNLAANATEKQVQDRLDALARENEVLSANLPIMKANLDAATAGSDAFKAYESQVQSTEARMREISTTLMTLAGDTLAAAKANDLAAEAEKKRVDSIKAVESYNTDISRINEQAAQKEADLATKYADKLVDIAAKAVEDAEKLLTQLETKLADLATDVGRDLDKDTRKANFDALQDQIEFQRDEVAETKKHYQDIERIRRQARAAEFEQGLDRDFAGLARSRRATAEQINESNIQFNEDRQARLDAFAAKRADDQAEFAFERQERLLQYEQDVADARAQYIRERLQLADAKNKQLAQAKAAYDKELALAQSKYRAELTARDSAIRTELQMIAGGNNAKLQLEQQYYQQSINILKNALGSVGGSVSSGASSSSSFSGGSGGGSANGAGNVGGIGGIFGVGASSTKTQSNTALNFGGLNINFTVGDAAQSQVRAILPAIKSTVESALTDYHRAVYGK